MGHLGSLGVPRPDLPALRAVPDGGAVEAVDVVGVGVAEGEHAARGGAGLQGLVPSALKENWHILQCTYIWICIYTENELGLSAVSVCLANVKAGRTCHIPDLVFV